MADNKFNHVIMINNTVFGMPTSGVGTLDGSIKELTFWSGGHIL